MKIRVIFSGPPHRESCEFDFAAVPREGECVAIPGPGSGSEPDWYKVHCIVHLPGNTSGKIEMIVHMITPAPKTKLKSAVEAKMTHARRRFRGKHAFLKSTTALLQDIVDRGRLIPGTSCDIPSDAAPEDIDRNTLARLFVMMLSQAMGSAASSVSFVLINRAATWSMLVDDKECQGSPPPWRAMQALIDEIPKAAGMSEADTCGTLVLKLRNKSVSLAVRREKSKNGSTVTISGLRNAVLTLCR